MKEFEEWFINQDFYKNMGFIHGDALFLKDDDVYRVLPVQMTWRAYQLQQLTLNELTDHNTMQFQELHALREAERVYERKIQQSREMIFLYFKLEQDDPELTLKAIDRCLVGCSESYTPKKPHVVSFKDWQIDWSLAPKGTYEWQMISETEAQWICEVMGGIDYEDAPTFGFIGDWKDSLRRRP